MTSTWFEQLFGFREPTGLGAAQQVQAQVELSPDGEWLHSRANGRRFRCGRLEVVSLAQLRARSLPAAAESRLSFREVVGDVRALHRDPGHDGALFQAASQFNLLEMVSPEAAPEDGVTIYSGDPTQGPACAMSCAAGTLLRNSLVDVDAIEQAIASSNLPPQGSSEVAGTSATERDEVGSNPWVAGNVQAPGTRLGQSSERQIDCSLALHNRLAAQLDVAGQRLWRMKNGYALATAEQLALISTWLKCADASEIDALRSDLHIGVQWNVGVTADSAHHAVTQAYCSAMPVAYNRVAPHLWEPLARIVLEATYEATLLAAAENARQTGNATVLLTLVGGGVFGNEFVWIVDALSRALDLVREHPLDVRMVSYGSENPALKSLLKRWS